ncbi:hypothetical protein AV530_005205 [Patagioenas fasciata monilis]|uniref:Uncharacterized protein n=1 Tax=Patagioenas fasciata monilis TaxID=372326 RepID=A0A1V4JKI2_PATFA|nr:hypothetical protein AV530_005205 [Patagioenas fasciata monilis]
MGCREANDTTDMFSLARDECSWDERIKHRACQLHPATIQFYCHVATAKVNLVQRVCERENRDIRKRGTSGNGKIRYGTY